VHVQARVGDPGGDGRDDEEKSESGVGVDGAARAAFIRLPMIIPVIAEYTTVQRPVATCDDECEVVRLAL
jgi:hypothetical protein